MQTGFIIRCPNRRRGNSGAVCLNTLKIVDGIQANTSEIVYCSACRAQAHLEFNKYGALTINIPQNKITVHVETYPSVSEGVFTKVPK